MLRVAVEGNISTGKSSLLSYFNTHYGPMYDVIYEPISKWQSVGGENLLNLLYSDPTRWAFPFQQFAMTTKVQSDLAPQGGPVIILQERSIYSSRFVFTEQMKRANKLSPAEFGILDHCFNFFLGEFQERLRLDAIVYLESPPATCLSRVKERNRPEEQSITLDYLSVIDDLHNSWLLESGECMFGAKLIRVNGAASKEAIPKMYESLHKTLYDLI